MNNRIAGRRPVMVRKWGVAKFVNKYLVFSCRG